MMSLLVALAATASASTADVSPLAGLLLEPGEMSGFIPGKPQVFRAVASIEAPSGEEPGKPEIERYEAEGFVEAATVRMHSSAEPGAKGLSSVFEFETPLGAKAEMKAELKEEFDPVALRREGILDYLVLRRFRVPGVSGAIAFAFLPNRTAERAGLESGVAKGFFVDGNCLFAVGAARFKSSEVIEPVVSGVQALSRRSGGNCPDGSFGN
jgi:hypothetical protein